MHRFPMGTEKVNKDCLNQQNGQAGQTGIWCITPNGLLIARQISEALCGCDIFASAKILPEGQGGESTQAFLSLSKEVRRQFHRYRQHIFIFSTGIAVRMISPLIISKLTDPAVVVVDETGRFAVSLVSGHIGGANQLALDIGKKIHAQPVITTATDANDLPAIDVIAVENNLFIETPKNIKHVSMAFLKRRAVSIYDPFSFVTTKLPDSLIKEIEATDAAGSSEVFCSFESVSVSRETLVLRPRMLHVGVGCNRNTPCDIIHQFLIEVFEKNNISSNSICSLCTSEIKRDEKGLSELGHLLKVPIDYYTNEALNSVKNIRTPSRMVEKHIGVKSVCEAAAILSSGRGNLIVEKHKNKDVTIAVAIKE